MPPKQFVGAFSTQRDRCSGFAELGKKPDWQRAGIRTRFIRVISELLDGALQIQFRIEVQFLVLCPVFLDHPLDIAGLVETASSKRNRESLQPGGRCLRGIMQDRRRIDAAAQPHTQWDIRNEVLANRLLQKRVQFLTGRLQAALFGYLLGQSPVRIPVYFAVSPLQPISWKELLYSVYQRPGRRNIVQRQITIQAGKA